MTTTLVKQARHGLLVVACTSLVAIACGRHAPYQPIENDTPRATVVHGTVRDTGANPVAGAVVTLDPAQNGVSAAAKWMIEHPNTTGQGVPGRRVTVTSELGRYAFDGVGSGEYVLHVLAENHLGAVRTLKVPQAALADTIIVDVNLTPTGDFTGNTFLEAASSHANTIVYVEGTSYVAVTSPSGSYTIHGVPIGSYMVRATHPGYLDETRDSTITTAGEVVTLPDMTLLIDANIPPTAVASAPSQACELDPVMLSGSGSQDPDGAIVSYAWDFEDDGSVDHTSSGAGASHSYSPGTHRAKLRVTDDKGAIGLDVVTFAVVKAETVFVATTGNDSNPGTRSLPMQTIGAGLLAASAYTLGSCPAVVVVAGDHAESPVFLPHMRVLGGFDSATWTRSTSSYSVVDVQATPALVNNINDANGATTISGFDFQAAGGSGAGGAEARNSIAMRVVASSALQFQDCRFQSGNGAGGPNGAVGTAGGNGSAGNTNNGGTSGGLGGAGGSPGGLGGGNGGPHTVAGTTGGGGCGTGGAAGSSAPCSSTGPGDGAMGGSGCPGAHGANGAAQDSYGSAGTDWTPLGGFAGLNGTAGGGGGGGGGGGDYFPDGNPACPFLIPGAGGGGGGGGGGLATSGAGGGGGGASFAVYLYNSSPSFVDCRFTTGAGGAGGAGGNGGSAGGGGTGGLSTYNGGALGGRGGNGGAGGHGGAGSGGPGGPSYCVYRGGLSTPVLTGSIFVTGSGGQGGAAGVRADNVPAPAGLNGPAGTVGP